MFTTIKMKLLTLASMSLCIASCATIDHALSGKTIGRLDATRTERTEGTISIDRPRELRMWAEIDALYEGEPMIDFDIQVYREGALVYSCSDDALWHYDEGQTRSYMFMRNSNRNGRQHTRYQKRLFECTFTPPSAGPYRFELRRKMLLGEFFQINKCNLLIKTR